MTHATSSHSRTAQLTGGWSLIAAAVGFMAVFSWLAARFNYPDVLDGPASDVLPNLLELGATGRAVWAVYAFLPMLLVPAGIGAYAALRQHAPNAMRLALVFSVLTGLTMLLGLARWPTIHWSLAHAWASASPDARVVIAAVFDGLNMYLGNFIGEFVGEISLNFFFLLTAFALFHAGHRKIAYAGWAAGVIGLVAAFRNVSPAVSLIAEIDNYVLPLWLIVLGIVLLTDARRQQSR